MCDLSDIEVTEKNVQVVSYVDDDGQSQDTKETYYGEIDGGYYNCNGCQEYWPWTMANRIEVWQTVKKHLKEN